MYLTALSWLQLSRSLTMCTPIYHAAEQHNAELPLISLSLLGFHITMGSMIELGDVDSSVFISYYGV